jgi:hypothetical protein
MSDYVYIAILAGFALLSVGFLVLCDRLMGGGK